MHYSGLRPECFHSPFVDRYERADQDERDDGQRARCHDRGEDAKASSDAPQIGFV